jgi:hypothetical protein
MFYLSTAVSGVLFIAASTYVWGPYYGALVVGSIFQTAIVAYLLLRIMLSWRLRRSLEWLAQTKTNAFLITATVTALLELMLRPEPYRDLRDLPGNQVMEWEDLHTLRWIGWAIGLGFIAWRMSRWEGRKRERDEAAK